MSVPPNRAASRSAGATGRPNRRLARQPDRQRAHWLAGRQPARQLLARRPSRWPAIWLSDWDRCFAGQPSGWPAGRPAGQLAGQLASRPACRSARRPAFSRPTIWQAHRFSMGRLYNVAAESSLLSFPPLPSLYLNFKNPNGVKVPALINSNTFRCLRHAREMPAYAYFGISRCLRDACAVPAPANYSTIACEGDACACKLNGVKVPALVNTNNTDACAMPAPTTYSTLTCQRDACACILRQMKVPSRSQRMTFTARGSGTWVPSLINYGTPRCQCGHTAGNLRHAKTR